MSKPRIAIIGLGVIGTSLGLALRKAQDDFEIIGHDKDSAKARAASKAGAVHKTDWNLISTVEDADAIILALPVSAIHDTMEHIAQDLKKGVLITDTANVKAPVLEWARELLPADANFIGGDPILPKGQSGQDPNPDLFNGAIYCLIPSPTAAPDALHFASSMAELLGAQPFFLDAAEHDGLVAGSEHLPMVMATAFLQCTQNAASWKEMRKIASTAYECGAFLGSEDASSLRSAILSNSANVTRWIDRFAAALQQLRDLVEQGDEKKLEEAFSQALDLRASWLRERELKRWDMAEQQLTETPQRPSFLRQAFLGGGLPSSRKDKEEKKKR
jgi:prephenate dehydrogenase